MAAFAAALIAGAASAAYDDEPAGLSASSSSLARVRALYDRAHGKDHSRAITIFEDWRLFADGTVGSFRVTRLGRDVRETTTLGPLTYARGVLHGVHWEQNRNGQVFSYPGIHDARDAASDRALRDSGDERDVRLLGDSTALGAYVLEINPPAGRHEWVYVDRRTGFIVRRESIARHRRYVTTYDDYRLVDGVGEPSRVRTVDSLGNEREQTLVNRTFDQTPDPHDVDIPAPRRLLEFPEKLSTVRLPVHFVDGLAVVRVLVGRTGYDFLLDSGAAGIVVDPALVEQQGLERFGQRVGATIGIFPEETTIVPQMTLGGLRMRNVVSRVVTIPFRLDDRTHVMGLLGFDFFADAVVHLDVEKGIAEAIAPEHLRVPGDAVAVPIALDDKTPAARLRVGGVVGRIVVDTGANRSVFETAFADKSDFSRDRVGATRVRGMGGVANAEAARIGSFDLGGISTRDAVVDVATTDLGADDVDGVIGTDLLRAFDLWFDDRAGAIYVRKVKR